MNDAELVALVERRRDLGGDRQRSGQRQKAADEPLRERLAFEVLEHEVVGVAFVSDVEERADVGML